MCERKGALCALPAPAAKLASVFLLCLFLGLSGCCQIRGKEPLRPEPTPAENASAGLPPLTVDRSAPLLLEESDTGEAASTGADNQACYVCHENFRREPLVAWHAQAELGCVSCHGESLAHQNDENNVTPPDIMVPAEAIDDSCTKCHKKHIAPAAEVIARWQERCPQKKDPSRIVCTDCHGAHRLAHRTVRWDRKTGALLGTHNGDR